MKVSSFADIESVRMQAYAGVTLDPPYTAVLAITDGVSKVAKCHRSTAFCLLIRLVSGSIGYFAEFI
ncbi:hypothetical protein BH23CYA1_BH23CYA1_17620 [soil metagenome]